MFNNESMEMYLETVYILENNNGHAHVSEVAERLDVSMPSVTKAMKLLRAEGLIYKEPYGSITLTEEGRRISEKIHKKHKLITLFLKDSLKLDAIEAEENACRIEHILSQKMLNAIKEYLRSNNIDFK